MVVAEVDFPRGSPAEKPEKGKKKASKLLFKEPEPALSDDEQVQEKMRPSKKAKVDPVVKADAVVPYILTAKVSIPITYMLLF